MRRCAILALFIMTTGFGACPRKPAARPVLIDDERVYRIVAAGDGLACVDAAGETAPPAAVAGWYAMSPGRVARVAERLRRCP